MCCVCADVYACNYICTCVSGRVCARVLQMCMHVTICVYIDCVCADVYAYNYTCVCMCKYECE